MQRDIWSHQHPSNCQDPNVRFLVADWERLPGFGMGGQIAGMCGLLAIAINEKRVLVTNYYNRADHDGCKGINCQLKITVALLKYMISDLSSFLLLSGIYSGESHDLFWGFIN